jgi:hypothetical protein
VDAGAEAGDGAGFGFRAGAGRLADSAGACVDAERM